MPMNVSCTRIQQFQRQSSPISTRSHDHKMNFGNGSLRNSNTEGTIPSRHLRIEDFAVPGCSSDEHHVPCRKRDALDDLSELMCAMKIARKPDVSNASFGDKIGVQSSRSLLRRSVFGRNRVFKAGWPRRRRCWRPGAGRSSSLSPCPPPPPSPWDSSSSSDAGAGSGGGGGGHARGRERARRRRGGGVGGSRCAGCRGRLRLHSASPRSHSSPSPASSPAGFLVTPDAPSSPPASPSQAQRRLRRRRYRCARHRDTMRRCRALLLEPNGKESDRDGGGAGGGGGAADGEDLEDLEQLGAALGRIQLRGRRRWRQEGPLGFGLPLHQPPLHHDPLAASTTTATAGSANAADLRCIPLVDP